jgi:hypothetical protein
MSQETNQLVIPEESKKGSTDTTLVLMGSIGAADSTYHPAPSLPTLNFDITYFSVAADDSIIFCLYDYDSIPVYWRPIPKLTSLPVTRAFRGIPVYGIGVVRADTANTFYEIIWY